MNRCIKTPIQCAQEKWEEKTTEFPKMYLVRPVVKNNPIYHKQDFRRFGNAIAWVQWNKDCIEIKKLETLHPHGGGPTRLIEFLKALADEFQIPLWGHAKAYVLDRGFPKEHLLTQEQLETFYEGRGFKLRKIDNNASEISYFPQKPTDVQLDDGI